MAANSCEDTQSIGGLASLKAQLAADKRPEGVEDKNDDAAAIELGSAAEEEAFGAARAALKAKGVEPNEFWLRCCVQVHKNDAAKAAARYDAYYRWRAEFGIQDGGSADVEEHLRVGKMRFTTGHDVEGRPVVNLRLRLHDPATYSAARMIRLLHYVLEYVLRTDTAAMRYGICMLGDASDIGYANIDGRIPKEISRAFSGHFPLRLGRLIFYKPPFFFRMIFPIVKMFMKEKITARIRGPITARVQLLDLVDKSQLLPEYGGTLAYDTQSWIDTCIAAHRTWASEGGEAKAK